MSFGNCGKPIKRFIFHNVFEIVIHNYKEADLKSLFCVGFAKHITKKYRYRYQQVPQKKNIGTLKHCIGASRLYFLYAE